MTDHEPLAPIEALADDWAAKQLRNRGHFVDGPIPIPKSPHLPPLETFEPVSELRAALAEAREAIEGLVAERDKARADVADLVSEGIRQKRRAIAAEAERDQLREALGRVEAVRVRWETALGLNSCPSCAFVPETDCDHGEGYHHALSDLRAALSQPATDEEAGQ